jgi:hypothetical protein
MTATQAAAANAAPPPEPLASVGSFRDWPRTVADRYANTDGSGLRWAEPGETRDTDFQERWANGLTLLLRQLAKGKTGLRTKIEYWKPTFDADGKRIGQSWTPGAAFLVFTGSVAAWRAFQSLDLSNPKPLAIAVQTGTESAKVFFPLAGGKIEDRQGDRHRAAWDWLHAQLAPLGLGGEYAMDHALFAPRVGHGRRIEIAGWPVIEPARLLAAIGGRRIIGLGDLARL